MYPQYQMKSKYLRTQEENQGITIYPSPFKNWAEREIY